MKYFFLLWLTALSLCSYAQTDTRSDSADILHYTIDLNISDISSQNIAGFTTVKFRSLVNNLNNLRLDLLKLTISSIELNGNPQSFTYNDTVIKMNFSTPFNIGDVAEVKIFYSGNPKADASWGGFYFTPSYAYNLGVAFTSKPHNFGRVWFPCFDNFTEKSTYEFYIRTASDHKAFCNGLLLDSTENLDNSMTWHWKLNQKIPTYLASVAVSDYTSYESIHNGANGPVPVILAARPGDINKMKSSFVNLGSAIDAFEEAYGPHPFDRVGFVVVPFSGGAMEHATNIAYPLFAIDGTTNSETLFAHELSHHWWGDMVTCRTAEDMWLNEGWASYSERIFLEKNYGRAAYDKAVMDNHMYVLRYAHVGDGGQYRAISGIPHEFTYGDHVYKKGADVAHTLRGYLGDSIFFNGIGSFLFTFKFKDASSIDFRDHLTGFSNRSNSFFNDWVFSPGFPHFSIEERNVINNSGTYTIDLKIRQKLRGSTAYFQNVPMEFRFYKADGTYVTKEFILGSEETNISHTLNFDPAWIVIDPENKISDAITENQLLIDQGGSYNFDNGMMSVSVSSINGPAQLRVEHHWVAADQQKNPVPGLFISNSRYWTVDGLFPSSFDATATISFDGRAPLDNTTYGHLDHSILRPGKSEDSIVLCYRVKAADNWQLYPHYTISTGTNKFDRVGSMNITKLQAGEYAFGMYDVSLSNEKLKDNTIPSEMLVFPNPANNELNILMPSDYSEGSIKIFDLHGKLIWERSCNPSELITWNTEGNTDGIYYLVYNSPDSSRSVKVALIR